MEEEQEKKMTDERHCGSGYCQILLIEEELEKSNALRTIELEKKSLIV